MTMMRLLMDQICNKISVSHKLVEFATKKDENLSLSLTGCDLSPEFMKAYATVKF